MTAERVDVRSGVRSDVRPDVRRVARSVDELVGADADPTPLISAAGKSGARLERVIVDGQPHVLKHLHSDDDWLVRATGDLAGRAITLWRTGWLDRLPACIDHTVVGAAWDDRPHSRGGAILMRDVGAALVPEGDQHIPLDQHLRFIDHMAQLHVAFWDCRDTIGLLALSERFTWFGPRLAEVERARGGTDLVPTQLVPTGWARLVERAPAVAEAVAALHQDPSPLVAALATTPQTLVHGDWKAGNLGSHADGRTILLDWDVPGVAPACADIAHYLCLNAARLPQSKEEVLECYRAGLERHGIDSGGWWQRQSELCLLGQLVLFGWEKALGDDVVAAEELAWWEARALAATRHL